MSAPRLLGVLALLWGSLVFAATDSRVSSGIEHFDQGEFALARDTLVAAVEARTLSSDDRAEARAYLAAAYQALGDAASAKAQLLLLVRERPDYRLDPGLFLPELVALADQARAEVASEPKPPEPVRPEPLPEASPVLTPTTVVAAPERPSLGWMFVPFGVGQFTLGDNLKGTLFLGSEVVALGTSGVALAMFESNKTSGAFLQGGTFRDPEKAATLQTIHLVAGYTGLALMVGGVIDALMTRADQAPQHGVSLSVRYTGQGLLVRF